MNEGLNAIKLLNFCRLINRSGILVNLNTDDIPLAGKIY